MRARPEQTRLIIAVLASVLAHAVGIVALAGSYGTFLDGAHEPITAADEQEEIRLGIERSAAQTIDWIGYEEYRQHLAPPAEQSQALMERGAASASAPTPPVEQPTQQEQSPPEAILEGVETAARTVEELLLDPLLSLIEDPLFFVSLDPKKPEKATDAEPSTTPEQTPPPSPQAPPAVESQTTDEKPGNANKDADAVSRETPEEFKDYIIGRPLSAEGLDIQTIRPQWSHRTRIMARPRNPRVTIHFNHEGKVTLATIEGSSGDRDVDRPLLDAIYRWRATGDRLADLSKGDAAKGVKGETISISLTIRLR